MVFLKKPQRQVEFSLPGMNFKYVYAGLIIIILGIIGYQADIFNKNETADITDQINGDKNEVGNVQLASPSLSLIPGSVFLGAKKKGIKSNTSSVQNLVPAQNLVIPTPGLNLSEQVLTNSEVLGEAILPDGEGTAVSDNQVNISANNSVFSEPAGPYGGGGGSPISPGVGPSMNTSAPVSNPGTNAVSE